MTLQYQDAFNGSLNLMKSDNSDITFVVRKLDEKTSKERFKQKFDSYLSESPIRQHQIAKEIQAVKKTQGAILNESYEVFFFDNKNAKSISESFDSIEVLGDDKLNKEIDAFVDNYLPFINENAENISFNM